MNNYDETILDYGQAIPRMTVAGLPHLEQTMLEDLIGLYNFHLEKNQKKNRYYNGHITLAEVNLGIALPQRIKMLEVGCEWGAKAVDVLAARSIFDGFVVDGTGGEEVEDEARSIVTENRLIAEYAKAARDELKYGATFATISAGESGTPSIRFHSPLTAAARWNSETGGIEYGMAITETAKTNGSSRAIRFRLDTDRATWDIRETGRGWVATEYAHNVGRPLMEPLTWAATSDKPFGRSRLKAPIRNMIDSCIRTIANATIGLEFATTPQKYLFGLTDEQFDQVMADKFSQYAGSLLTSTTNPETGENPQFGQLQQGSLTPHVEMMRMIATQFASATGLSTVDVGIVNDANPTSSDAILAQSKTLTTMAEEMNAGNGDALRILMLKAIALSRGVSLAELMEDRAARSLLAHFKNPAMPSVSMTADAAVKIASVRDGFANTDIFLEMIGFDRADIRRVKSQEARARGIMTLSENIDALTGGGEA